MVSLQVAEARRGHEHYVQRVLDFMTKFDLLCCPCVMVAPFDVDIRYAEHLEVLRIPTLVLPSCKC